MFFQMVLFVWSFVLDLATVCRLTESEKDLEIMLLRQQLRIVERKQQRGPSIPRWQRVPLVALARHFKHIATTTRRKLDDNLLLFKPATLLGWHRALVRWQWTFKGERKPGRPPIDSELEH